MDPKSNGSLQDSCFDRTANFAVRFLILKKSKDRFHKKFACAKNRSSVLYRKKTKDFCL